MKIHSAQNGSQRVPEIFQENYINYRNNLCKISSGFCPRKKYFFKNKIPYFSRFLNSIKTYGDGENIFIPRN